VRLSAADGSLGRTELPTRIEEIDGDDLARQFLWPADFVAAKHGDSLWLAQYTPIQKIDSRDVTPEVYQRNTAFGVQVCTPRSRITPTFPWRGYDLHCIER
jgi:hypothetical protein